MISPSSDRYPACETLFRKHLPSNVVTSEVAVGEADRLLEIVASFAGQM